jgi:hypothetical protein
MAKVKKFAEGRSVTDKFLDYVTDKDTRSVMDIPKKDMRDPQYGKISSASTRADGCAQRGKTKGRMV